MNDVTENMVTEEKVSVMSDTSTVEKKIESIVFNTLKSKVKGHIYVKMQKNLNEEFDSLYVSITNEIKYSDNFTIPESMYNMVSENEKVVDSLACMIIDSYKKYLDFTFFFPDRPKKFNKNTKYRKPETREN